MEIEGRLQFQIHCQNDIVTDVKIHSTRPLKAVQVFHGKHPQDVLTSLPLIYHVCGTAQAKAAVNACEQAMGISPVANTELAREMLIWTETAREHLWRILVDWTESLQLPKDTKTIASLQRLVPELKQSLFCENNPFLPGAGVDIDHDSSLQHVTRFESKLNESLFAMPPAEWLKISSESELLAWANQQQTLPAQMLRHLCEQETTCSDLPDIGFLPVLDEATLHQYFEAADVDNFIAQPVWLGKVCETTPLARQQQHPLVAGLIRSDGRGLKSRHVARLVELAGIPGRLRQHLDTLKSSGNIKADSDGPRETGVGIGQVEAARGRLVHRVQMGNGRIQKYQILAPTEWNFHPDGIAARLLKTLLVSDESQLKKQAGLLINSIDPCVAYEMVVH